MSILLGYLRTYTLVGVCAYLLLVILARLISPLLPQTSIFSAHELRLYHTNSVVSFSFLWIIAMSVIYCILARNIKTKPKELFLHMGVIAMLGPICEVAINNFCRFAFGTPLWVYHFLPVHHGDTSLYSFFVWGMYGCHLYFMDRRFIHSSASHGTILFALILSIDAVILEFALNLTSIYVLHTYIFFYLPNDVHHLTTLAVVPFYLLGGILAAETLKRCFKHPVFFGSICFLAGFLFTFFL